MDGTESSDRQDHKVIPQSKEFHLECSQVTNHEIPRHGKLWVLSDDIFIADSNTKPNYQMVSGHGFTSKEQADIYT